MGSRIQSFHFYATDFGVILRLIRKRQFETLSRSFPLNEFAVAGMPKFSIRFKESHKPVLQVGTMVYDKHES